MGTRLLVERGADVNAMCSWYGTLLDIAFKSGDQYVIKILEGSRKTANVSADWDERRR